MSVQTDLVLFVFIDLFRVLYQPSYIHTFKPNAYSLLPTSHCLKTHRNIICTLFGSFDAKSLSLENGARRAAETIVQSLGAYEDLADEKGANVRTNPYSALFDSDDDESSDDDDDE